MTLIKTILLSSFKFTLVCLFILFLFWLPTWYAAKPINNFCHHLPFDSTYDNILLNAKKRTYTVFKETKNDMEVLSITTQRSPFFRMACIITFKDKRMVSKAVHSAD